MWSNAKPSSQDDDEDSWQVRAFEEDTTGNLLGCTWPPRSYTCSFCRREFRSAQALGGHMNVHRRDRARLHDAPPPSTAAAARNGQEFVASGLCLLYPLPNPNSILFPNLLPTEFSIPIRTDKTAPNSAVSSVCPSSQSSPPESNDGNAKDLAVEEELDLELRLGPRLPPSS